MWEAVQELRAKGTWAVEGIRQVAPAFEAKLAAGQPHDLPALTAPTTPPGVSPDLSPMQVQPSMHPKRIYSNGASSAHANLFLVLSSFCQ